jgi:hypothetical protein
VCAVRCKNRRARCIGFAGARSITGPWRPVFSLSIGRPRKWISPKKTTNGQISDRAPPAAAARPTLTLKNPSRPPGARREPRPVCGLPGSAQRSVQFCRRRTRRVAPSPPGCLPARLWLAARLRSSLRCSALCSNQ